MSGARVIVAYPRKEGSTFNKEYYLSTHMPLVKKTWEKHGLKSYDVVELSPDAPYSISVVMHFESHEGWAAAGADPATKDVMGDVPNFSSEQPMLLHGSVIGSG